MKSWCEIKIYIYNSHFFEQDFKRKILSTLIINKKQKYKNLIRGLLHGAAHSISNVYLCEYNNRLQILQ